MNEDKLIELYNAGKYELLRCLMDGLELEYLNLPSPKFSLGKTEHFECISGITIALFPDGDKMISHVDLDNDLHELSIAGFNSYYYVPKKSIYIDILNDSNLNHLSEYLKIDNIGGWCLGLIPWTDVLRIIFAKSNKNENSN